MSDFVQHGVYDHFLAYRAAIMQAIALAWRDPAFRDQLIADPKAALKTGVGYKFPFNMELAVDVDNAVWRPHTVTDWQVKHHNLLELPLPPAPEAVEQVEALAAFNAQHLTFLHN
jgi:ribosomally synthesized peptide (two-chain TOMM family)